MNLPSVRLADFKLRAYRSCKSAAFSADPCLTALIGSNGSGKTNLLQGFMLLCGTRPSYAPDAGDAFVLESRISATFIVQNKRVYLRSSVVYRPTDQNRDEIVDSKDEWNFNELTGRNQWRVVPLPSHYFRARFLHMRVLDTPDLKLGVRYRPKDDINKEKLIFLKIVARREKLLRRELNALLAIDDFTSNTAYYTASQFTDPTRCPSWFEIDEKGDLYEQEASTSRSRDHLQFIYQLYRMRQTQNPLYSTYMSLVDKHGLGLIRQIKWKETKYSTKAYEVRAGGRVIERRRKRLLIIPTVHIGDSQLSFAQLSEGTFRTLAILFYVVTDKSRLLLLEEPEVCVHHGLLSSVVDIIRDFARNKQIIFSTHSENVLDKLQPEQVRLVSKQKSGTIIRAISKKMSARHFRALKKYLKTEGSLGEYWRHSGFDE